MKFNCIVTKIATFAFFFLSTAVAQPAYQIDPVNRLPHEPRVTIIISVFKCDAFIEGFLEDIVQQTIFEECELLMIDANSPGNERAVIRKYMERFPNITYIRLKKDPGLFGVWNIGLRLARSEYVCNANTDDRLNHKCYQLHAHMLDQSPEIDLVYSDFYITKKPNDTMKHTKAKEHSQFPNFTPQAMCKCLPGMNPMWRKSMHTKHGYFNEDFLSAGDWEMWCRAVEGGSVFKKVHAITGLYYQNPQGLSTNQDKMRLISRERELVRRLYSCYWYAKCKKEKKRVLTSQKDRSECARKKSKKRREVKKNKKRRIRKRTR